MRRILIVAVATAAGVSVAAAQTAMDDYDDGAMPSIILPDQLTNPITGDFNARDDGVAAGGDAETDISPGEGETWVQPYSVEGEETLEPESN